MARHNANVNLAPAKAIDKVADPAPAFAFTTSVPASYIQWTLVGTNSELMPNI